MAVGQSNAGTGGVYIYEKNVSDNWVRTALIQHSVPAAGDEFGTSVSLNLLGDILVLGAPSRVEIGTLGVVYVYKKILGIWNKTHEFRGIGGIGVKVATDGTGTKVVTIQRDNGDIWFFNTQGFPAQTISQTNFVTPTDPDLGGLVLGDISINRQGTIAFGSSGQGNSVNMFIFNEVNNTWLISNQILSIQEKVTDKLSSLQGTSLSVRDNILLVGAPRRNGDVGAIYLWNINDNFGRFDRELFGSDYVRMARFGHCVSMSSEGTYAVIGGIFDGVLQTGAIWIYKRDGSNWKQVGNKIIPPSLSTLARAGITVDISDNGSVIVIGTLENKAFIYNKKPDVEEWNLFQTLIGTDFGAQSNSYFGETVQISNDGEKIAVGGSFHDFGSANQGAIWYFTFNGTTWTSAGPVEGTGTGAGSFMAIAVNAPIHGSKMKMIDPAGPFLGAISQGPNTLAISGDGSTIAAGAPSYSATDGGVWVFLNGVYEDGPLQGTGTAGGFDRQGASVALSYDGNTLAFGAPAYSTTGAVIVFTRLAGVWSEEQIITISVSTRLGYEVDLSADGNILMASEDDSLGGNPASIRGKIWVFRRVSGVWTPLSLIPITGDTTNLLSELAQFGHSISMSGNGNISIVGEPGRILSPVSDGSPTGGIYSVN